MKERLSASDLFFGVPETRPDPTYPLQMWAFQLKNLTLRSGVTLERGRVLGDAGCYLTDHPQLAESYVSHVFDLNDVQTAYTRPSAGQHKMVVRTV